MSTRAALPERVRRWCATALGDDVVGAERIGGGNTDAIWRVRHRDGSAILRWLDPDHPYAADGRPWVVREALGCRLTRGSAVPAPVLLASDPDGEATGGWASLTTFLPGRVRLDRLGPAAVDALADVAVAVHAIDVGEAVRPPPFTAWTPARLEVPTWSRRPALWAEAIERLPRGPARDAAAPHPPRLPPRATRSGRATPSPGSSTGPRRRGGRRTSTSRTPAPTSRCCTRSTTRVAFAAAYERRGGRLDPDPEARRWWTCLDVLGFLPDPGPIVVALTRQRPDLDADGVRGRLEDLLELALAG